MIKRAVWLTVFFLVVSHVLALRSYAAPLSPSPARDATDVTADLTPTPGDAITQEKQQYLLPYPGILPDHPLYFLKRFRDWILESLIVDPVRKAEFYILQADKHLNMGTFLLEKGNIVLALEMISSGETFMEKAVLSLKEVKAGGREIPGHVGERLMRSMVKHGEVLEEDRLILPEIERQKLDTPRETLRRAEELLGTIR
ncbi:MAG: DUF5667 domain-containing protein [bacterium]|nr:DUF5667 domain-containing protein [bacterium]